MPPLPPSTNNGRKSMTKELLAAIDLANSLRGKYILSQALHYGILALRSVPEHIQEKSNIQDMETLRGLFDLFTPINVKKAK